MKTNPQIEEGYFQFSNELAQAFTRVNLYPYEFRVLMVVLRKTWGWHKEMDRISFSQIAEMSGIPRQNAARAMTNLVSRNIIKRRGTGKKLYYGLQENYELWEAQVPSVKSTPEAKNKSTSSLEMTNKPKHARMSSIGINTSSVESTKMSSVESHTKDNKDTLQKIYIYNIFEHWNKQKIIVHDKITPAMNKAIEKAVKSYNENQVKKAVVNYGLLVNGDYEWTFKWTLVEFLERSSGNNIERFKDMEVLKQNYGRAANGNNKGNPRKLPQAGSYTRPEDYGKTP